MRHKIGDSVQARPEVDAMLGDVAGLIGMVGDAWADERGERVSVVYETVHLYFFGLPASSFDPAGETLR